MKSQTIAKLTLPLILISISTLLAKGAEWKYMLTDQVGNTYYVDTGSVLVEGDTRSFWIYKKFKEPRALNDKIFNEAKFQESIDCAKRTLRILWFQPIDSKGESSELLRVIPPDSGMPIIPDTINDLVREYVCSIKKSAE